MYTPFNTKWCSTVFPFDSNGSFFLMLCSNRCILQQKVKSFCLSTCSLHGHISLKAFLVLHTLSQSLQGDVKVIWYYSFCTVSKVSNQILDIIWNNLTWKLISLLCQVFYELLISPLHFCLQLEHKTREKPFERLNFKWSCLGRQKFTAAFVFTIKPLY